MRNPPVTLLCRLTAASLVLSGCAGSSIAPAAKQVETTRVAPTPTAESSSGATDVDTLRNILAEPLSPKEGIAPRNIGKRVRWAGAVQYIAATDDGVCLTILYALSGKSGEPRWTNDPTYQSFNACTKGSYDPELVGNSTNVTIVGRISGKTEIGMGGGSMVGPIVAIEKLFRWSDCLEGDTSAVCRYGFLDPQPASKD